MARRVASGPKRQTAWVGPADQGFVNVAAGAKVIVASFAPSDAAFAKPTIVRTRGDVACSVTGSSTTEVVGAYGLCVVTDRAFAAGVGSLPGPWSDPGYDGWFVWRSFGIQVVGATADGFIQAQINQEVDSKAMRKVTDDETIVLVAESQAITYDISMPLRMLFKLS